MKKKKKQTTTKTSTTKNKKKTYKPALLSLKNKNKKATSNHLKQIEIKKRKQNSKQNTTKKKKKKNKNSVISFQFQREVLNFSHANKCIARFTLPASCFTGWFSACIMISDTSLSDAHRLHSRLRQRWTEISTTRGSSWRRHCTAPTTATLAVVREPVDLDRDCRYRVETTDCFVTYLDAVWRMKKGRVWSWAETHGSRCSERRKTDFVGVVWTKLSSALCPHSAVCDRTYLGGNECLKSGSAKL